MNTLLKKHLLFLFSMILISCNSNQKSSANNENAEFDPKQRSSLSNALLKYNDYNGFYDGRSIVEKDKLYGIIDLNGEEIIPCIYEELYLTIHDKENKHYLGSLNNQDVYFDINGNLLTDDSVPNCQCQYKLESENTDGDFFIQSLLNIHTREKINLQKKYTQSTHSFSDGLCAVQWNEKWGFIDMAGKEVIPCIYEIEESMGDYYCDFFNGMARVAKKTQWGIINKKGEEIIPLIYDYVDMFFSDDLLVVAKNEKYGYVNTEGKVVIPLKYDYAQTFTEGLAAVQLNGKYGFINTKGEEIIPCNYYPTVVGAWYGDPIYFENGYAVVRSGPGPDFYGNDPEPANCGVLNSKGEVVIPLKYPAVFQSGKYFSCQTEACIPDGNCKYALLNEQGEEIIPPVLSASLEFHNGLSLAYVNNIKGYVDTEGYFIAPGIVTKVVDLLK